MPLTLLTRNCSYYFCCEEPILKLVKLIANALHFFDYVFGIRHTSWMSRLQTSASPSYRDFNSIPTNNSEETLENDCRFSFDHWLPLQREPENVLENCSFIMTWLYRMVQLLAADSSIIYSPFYLINNLWFILENCMNP